MKLLPFFKQTRHYTAFVSGILMNLNVFGISAKNICTPGFNCHGCPWATFSCPVGVIGYGFGIRSVPALAVGMILGTGIFFGRLVCAFACPFGLFQDILARVPLPKLKMPKFFRYGKYLTLLLLVILLPFIFGFQPTSGYLEVQKPKINKVTNDNQLPEAGNTAKPKVGLLNMLSPTSSSAENSEDKTSTDEIPPDLFKAENEPSPSADASPLPWEMGELAETPEEDCAGISVEITVKNVSNKTVNGFSLQAAYYTEAGEKIWEDEKPLEFSQTLKPGEDFTTPIFIVPNKLASANLTVTSPESIIKLDFWTLFCTYCPVAALEADIPVRASKAKDYSSAFYEATALNNPRIVITLIVIIGMLFIRRFFCRALCPLGAMYAILSKFSLFRIENKQQHCISCSIVGESCTKCDADCPVDLDVLTEAGGPECIACGNCIKVCPKGALVRKFGVK